LSDTEIRGRGKGEVLTNAAIPRSARLSVRFLIIFDGMMKAKIGISWVDIFTTSSVADERWRRMAEAGR
jgi:hypothetical protein